MRILITASREFGNTAEQRAQLQHVLFEATLGIPHQTITVVQGGARGGDQLAADFAQSLGYYVETHPVLEEDWRLHGKRAAYLRNKKMVELGASVCLAFIVNDSPGASMTAKLAEAASIPTFVYRYH